MGKVLGRIGVAIYSYGPLGLIVGVVAIAAAGTQSTEQAPIGRCVVPDCPIYSHSPEAWARSKTLGAFLFESEGAELDADSDGQGSTTSLDHPFLRSRRIVAAPRADIPRARQGMHRSLQGTGFLARGFDWTIAEDAPKICGWPGPHPSRN